MEEKSEILQTLFALVKGHADPTKTLISANELVLKMTIPWDEVVSGLKRLENDGYIHLQQLNVAAISITETGIAFATGVGKTAPLAGH